MSFIRQVQQQKLLQKLSPQQIQMMKLLQIPTANLENRIKEELELNPTLELNEYEEKKDPFEQEQQDVFSNENETESDAFEADDTIDVSEYLQSESDINAPYGYYDDEDEDSRETPIRAETTFHDHLQAQLGLLRFSEKEKQIALQIIGSIDDDGYLRREPESICDDLAFNKNVSTSVQEVHAIIAKVQQFDPPGVAAKDLQECLLLQLQRRPQLSTAKHAQEILKQYFQEFIRKNYTKIKNKLHLSEDDFKNAVQLITKLTPRPGLPFASDSKSSNYIIPDFFVHNNNGQLEITLNSRNAPTLSVSEEYKDMFKSYNNKEKVSKEEKNAVMFIKQKLDAAKWFISAIKQRQHTLLITMRAIVEFQKDFFLNGDTASLKPMILKDIAAVTNMDISTVSRVANSKYVQTEFGTFLLKFFFSDGIVNDLSGDEVSVREVKQVLQEIVNNEDKQKPYSDDKLAELLSEQGYTIARRTVAKYREMMDIPVARLRVEV